MSRETATARCDHTANASTRTTRVKHPSHNFVAIEVTSAFCYKDSRKSFGWRIRFLLAPLQSSSMAAYTQMPQPCARCNHRSWRAGSENGRLKIVAIKSICEIQGPLLSLVLEIKRTYSFDVVVDDAGLPPN